MKVGAFNNENEKTNSKMLYIEFSGDWLTIDFKCKIEFGKKFRIDKFEFLSLSKNCIYTCMSMISTIMNIVTVFFWDYFK